MHAKLISIARKYLQLIKAEYSSHAERYERLAQYGEYNLSRSRRDGKADQFYCQKRGCRSNKRIYLGNESSEVVEAIREFRFHEQFLNDADHNIGLLRNLIESLLPLDHKSVEGRMAALYRKAEITFCSADDERAINWKARKEAVKARFPVKYPDGLKYRALDGTMVRSKSELIIANMLIHFKIPFVYELPYVLDGITYYLDFTVLSTVDYQTEIIIEHQGMMDLDKYKGKFINTLTACLKSGIVPNENIYFTFDNYDGTVIDTVQILNIINSRLIPEAVEAHDAGKSRATS